MAQVPVDEITAECIWDVLVEHCGAHNDEEGWNMLSFIQAATDGRWSQWRFQGTLGFGGKVWNNDGRFYVNYYREDETSEREAAQKAANVELAKIYEEVNG